MPPRDESDFETRRQQIIDGALQVFASKGFEKATNKDIASAAKIGSPGLIYHYFKDKRDLFRQVMQERAVVLKLLSHGDELMDKPPREVLPLFADALLKTLDDRASVSMFKLMLSEAIRHSMVADFFNSIGPGRGFAFLSRYIEKQMDEGTLRRMDTGAAVRCFAGPLLAYVVLREVFVQPDAQTLDRETMIATVVNVFLEGMEPSGGN